MGFALLSPCYIADRHLVSIAAKYKHGPPSIRGTSAHSQNTVLGVEWSRFFGRLSFGLRKHFKKLVIVRIYAARTDYADRRGTTKYRDSGQCCPRRAEPWNML